LDLTSEDRHKLKFELKTSDKDISESKGPIYNPGSSQSKCTIYAPYIAVSSGDTGSVFEVDRSDAVGDLSDDEFMIAINTDVGSDPALCDDNANGAVEAGDYSVPAGSVFMKVSPSSDDYGVAEYASPGLEVRYDEIGDGDNSFAPPDGGAIFIEDQLDLVAPGDGYMDDLLVSAGWGGGFVGDDPDFMFGIAEKAGTGSSNEFVDYFMFGVDETGTATAADATFDFQSDDGSFDVTSDNEEVLYGHAVANPDYYAGPILSGPVTSGTEMVEEGYISERGSVFNLIDDNTVEFNMAHKLARAQWWLGPSETSSASDSATIVTLGEGESTTVGGVTVKVLEITETVGACSAAGGAVSCTADMSGVSAKIMPNNAASVQAAVYTNPGNLVVLDKDATGLSTVVSVGGDAVNSLSESWLASAPVDWTTEAKVVKEMEAGKILVAGATKEDTLQAAKDFVAQLQMS
jgi:hypothetical protein